MLADTALDGKFQHECASSELGGTGPHSLAAVGPRSPCWDLEPQNWDVRLLRDIHIRWAWIPAGVFVVSLSLHRWGLWITALLVLVGLGAGYYLNRRARREREASK